MVRKQNSLRLEDKLFLKNLSAFSLPATGAREKEIPK
jgi:hypothetical protein